MAVAAKPRRVLRPIAEKRPFLSNSADVFCAVLGLTTAFSIHFIGELYVAEILLLFALPIILVMRGKRALHPNLKIVFMLMCLWLLGLVIADAYNEIPINDRLRGMALIIFFGLNLIGMTALVSGNERRKIFYLLGLALGALAAVKLQPSEATHDYPWKFGYATGAVELSMLISSFFYARKRYIASTLVILGICAINLLLNFRSPVLGLLMTLVLVTPIPDHVGRFRLLPQSSALRLVVLALLTVFAAQSANLLVNFVTRAGYVNEEAQEKNEAQQKSGNLLLGGRPEVVIGLRAALDSPIIGHGSWAKNLKYFEMLNDMLVETGAKQEQTGGDIAEDADGLIPGHSHLITAWVWAGVAGLVFWLYMIWFVMRGILRCALTRPPLAPVYMTFMTGLVWDILFSPFAANRRFTEAVTIVIIADIVRVRAPQALLPTWRRMGAVRSLAHRNPSLPREAHGNS